MDPMEKVGGFVLAGGRSTRMGRDKALLPWKGGTLLAHVAGVVREAVGNVTIIGRGAHPDLIPDCGPLGGLLTAFAATTAERVVLVACDMPNLTPDLLRGMIAVPGDAVVCETQGRLHPLCAVYHRSLQSQVASAVQNRSLKMHDFLSRFPVQRYPVQDPALLKNLNTPNDWEGDFAA
jgi:molybdenum cofactor guanylyltransferase